MDEPPDGTALVTGRARSLAGPDGSVLLTRAAVLVSLERPLRLRTALATLSFGPLAALYLPAGVRAWCDEPDALAGASALWLVDAAAPARARRRELLPSRIPIDLDAFGALLGIARGAGAKADVIRWLRRDLASRQGCRDGRRPSLDAWRAWSDLAASIEQALAASVTAGGDFETVMRAVAPRERRAVARLLGSGLHRAFDEFRRRRLLLLAARRGTVDDAALRAAGYVDAWHCRRDFERACGESPQAWLRRHGQAGREQSLPAGETACA